MTSRCPSGDRYRALGAALVMLTAACFRHEEHLRPVRPDECPPVPPSHAYSRFADDPRRPGTLSGRIRAASAPGATSSPSSDSLMPPLGDVRIQVDIVQRTAVSDSSGRFAIDGLAPGRHAARVSRVGYRPRLDTVVITQRAGATWDVALEPAVLDGFPGFMSVVERKRVWRWPWQRTSRGR